MKKILTLAFVFSLLAGAANAACTVPLNITANAGTVPMDVVQGANGNCQSVTAPNVWYPGSSNSGLLATVLTLQTTELNALTNGSVIISSVANGATGKFTNADTGAARLGEVYFISGATATCTAGGNISGWFLASYDSGSTYEPTTLAPPRSPDFIIPFPTAAIGTSTYKGYGPIALPSLQFKVLVQNNCGATLGATGNIIKVAPIAQQN